MIPRPALGVALLGLLVEPASAREPVRLRLESTAGVDTNITRTEGESRDRGGLVRAVADADGGLQSGRLGLGVNYQAGARHFPGKDGEDGVFQRLGGQLSLRAASALAVGAALHLQDRTTRAPALDRDYTRVSGGPNLTVLLGVAQLSLLGRASRLAFKPNPEFDADGLGATAALMVPWEAWRFEVRGGWSAQRFAGDRLDQVGVTGSGLPYVQAVPGSRRRDDVRTAGLGVRYAGALLGQLEYVFANNISNSFRAGFVRHLVRGSATFELPGGVVTSLQVDVQRVMYDDPQFISLQTFIEDENRSAAKLRIERPVSERWSLVGHLGAWFSPFGAGPEYVRQTALLGLACNVESP